MYNSSTYGIDNLYLQMIPWEQDITVVAWVSDMHKKHVSICLLGCLRVLARGTFEQIVEGEKARVLLPEDYAPEPALGHLFL